MRILIKPWVFTLTILSWFLCSHTVGLAQNRQADETSIHAHNGGLEKALQFGQSWYYSIKPRSDAVRLLLTRYLQDHVVESKEDPNQVSDNLDWWVNQLRAYVALAIAHTDLVMTAFEFGTELCKKMNAPVLDPFYPLLDAVLPAAKNAKTGIRVVALEFYAMALHRGSAFAISHRYTDEQWDVLEKALMQELPALMCDTTRPRMVVAAIDVAHQLRLTGLQYPLYSDMVPRLEAIVRTPGAAGDRVDRERMQQRAYFALTWAAREDQGKLADKATAAKTALRNLMADDMLTTKVVLDSDAGMMTIRNCFNTLVETMHAETDDSMRGQLTARLGPLYMKLRQYLEDTGIAKLEREQAESLGILSKRLINLATLIGGKDQKPGQIDDEFIVGITVTLTEIVGMMLSDVYMHYFKDYCHAAGLNRSDLPIALLLGYINHTEQVYGDPQPTLIRNANRLIVDLGAGVELSPDLSMPQAVQAILQYQAQQATRQGGVGDNGAIVTLYQYNEPFSRDDNGLSETLIALREALLRFGAGSPELQLDLPKLLKFSLVERMPVLPAH